MKWAWIIGLVFNRVVSAAVLSVPASGLGLFSLDIDSDGIAEFSNFQFWAEGNQLVFEIHVDVIDLVTTFPDEPFVGIRGASFESLEALVSSSMFTGDLNVPAGYVREYDSIPGYVTVLSDNPLMAAWMYGSLGDGSDDLSLLGVVVDASDFFSSGGTADLKIFFHDYGAFGGGDGINGASLARTGILSDVSGHLDSVAEFIGPKSGLIRVPSQVGKSYHLKRGTFPGSGQTLGTLAGTGQVLTLSWDDAESSDTSAFFWVEETEP